MLFQKASNNQKKQLVKAQHPILTDLMSVRRQESKVGRRALVPGRQVSGAKHCITNVDVRALGIRRRSCINNIGA